jgi:hypothetical protein
VEIIMKIEKAYWNWQFINNVGLEIPFIFSTNYVGLEIPFICGSTCPTEHVEQRGSSADEAQGNGGGWDATSKVLNGLGFGAGVKDMVIEGGAALNRGTKIWNVNNTSVIRSYGAAGAKYLKLSKGLGVAGSVVTTLYSGSKVLDQITTPGGINNVKTRDVFDTVIGAAGVGAFFFMSSNPIGWGVGAGVLLYGAGTMIHDIYQEKNKK